MKINYENKPKYVLFGSLSEGDVFCTQECCGFTHVWIKRETWTNTDSENLDEGVSANAFGLDDVSDYHLFENADVVIQPRSISMNIVL